MPAAEYFDSQRPNVASSSIGNLLTNFQQMTRAGYINLDTKADNVMVDSDTGDAYFVDMGLARQISDPTPPLNENDRMELRLMFTNLVDTFPRERELQYTYLDEFMRQFDALDAARTFEPWVEQVVRPVSEGSAKGPTGN